MKKWLQFIAVLLTLAVASQPVFADTSCDQSACGTHKAMDCCPSDSTSAMSSMPMGMTCDESHPPATAPMLCTGGACCIVSAANAPALTVPALVSPSITVTLFPALLRAPAVPSVIRRTSAPRLVLPTPRYILFRDFRI